MLFDTDILIWVERGNQKAAKLIDDTQERFISLITYMELIQGAPSPKQARTIKNFLSEYNFEVLPLSENIGHRAAIYFEEYAFQSGMQIQDALIAATAMENNLALVTGNEKHFKQIRELSLVLFKS